MARTKRVLGVGAVALAVAIGVSACSDSISVGGPAHVTVLVTDAPMDYIESASVDIGAVVLVPADSGAHITLSEDGTDGPVNLLELQDAATELLGEADIEAGAYSQLRLIVESASVTLSEGYTFTDGTTEKDLFVPSGAQTGIKLLLGSADGGDEGEALVIPPGETMLVVDFDVSQSFVIQGNPETPAGIHGMIFKPTLRVVVADVAGSISGTVSTDLDSARVDSLTVTGTFAADTVIARTRMDGTYTLAFLAPGSYVVRVAPADTTLDVDPDSAVVVVDPSEDEVGVDFELDTIP